MACIITSSGDCKCITNIIGSLKKERYGIQIQNKNLVNLRHCDSHLSKGDIAPLKIKNLLMEIVGVIKIVSSSIWSQLPNREGQVLKEPNYPSRNNFIIPDSIMQHQPCLGKFSEPLIDSVKLKQRFYTIADAAESSCLHSQRITIIV